MVDLGFLAGTGTACSVILVVKIVELSGDELHDSHDLLPCFDAGLLMEVGDVYIADLQEVVSKGVVARRKFAFYLVDEFATQFVGRRARGAHRASSKEACFG